MNNPGSRASESIVSFAPKLAARSETGDQLDQAGQSVLGLLHRAAAAAEARYQQAIEMTQQLSAQLRAAEDRIRDLDSKARYHEERADRAERWLYQISVEIEQKFFAPDDGRYLRGQSAHAHSGLKR